MARFQFVDFVPTPGEKHIGIITVRIHGDPIATVRYKMVARKDGSGYFPNIASYKMPNRMPGEEYDECYMLEMRSDHDALIKFIMSAFNEWQKAQQPSVFQTPPVASFQSQPNPNYQAQTQQYRQDQPSFPDMPPDFGNPPF